MDSITSRNSVNPNEKALLMSGQHFMALPEPDQQYVLDVVHRNKYHLLITYNTPDDKKRVEALKARSGHIQEMPEQSIYANKEEIIQRHFDPSRVTCVTNNQDYAYLFQLENISVCLVSNDGKITDSIKRFDTMDCN